MKNFHTLLVERGVASMRQVEEAMARQVLYGSDLASHVLEQIGQDHEGALNLALAAHYHLEPADAGPLPLAASNTRQVPWEIALRHSFYPLRLEDRALYIAVFSPLPEEVEGDLFFQLSIPTRQLITSRIRIRQALARDNVTPLDNREQRSLARIEGRPLPPGSIPPPAPAAPPSVRAMTLRLPAVRPTSEPSATPAAPAPSATPAPATPLPTSPISPAAVSVAPQDARNPAWPQATKGLLRWMQRASRPDGTARPRRRRGPMPLSECEEGLNQAATGEEVLQIFFDFAQQFFAYSALFVVQGDLAEGRDSFGAGAEPERVAGIGIPLDLPSCLAQARNLGAPVSVPLRIDGIDASLAADLKRSPRGAVFTMPITVRQRCIALLYGDNGDESAELGDAAEVISAGSLAGGALERLAVERKRKRSTETGAPQPAPARKSTLAGMPAVAMYTENTTQASQHRQQKTQALARALGLPSDLPKAAVPPPTLASPRALNPEESNPFRRLTASFQAVSPSATPPADEPVPATVLAVPAAAPTPAVPLAPPGDDGPEVQVGEADLDDELVRSALREVMEGNPSYPRSERSSYHPPSSPPSEHKLAALPSIIVDLDNEQVRLLDLLTASSEDNDEALGEILKEGVRMVPALLLRLPGPLRASKEALFDGSVKPSQGGPVLRALVALRKTALPFLVVQSGSTQSEARRLATLLLGEFPYPEVVQGLLPRFFDADPGVIQSAQLSARRLRSSPDVFAMISGGLRRISASPEESAERRSKAQAALDDIQK